MPAPQRHCALLMSLAVCLLLACARPALADEPAQDKLPGSVSELRQSTQPRHAPQADMAPSAMQLTALPLLYRDCSSIAYQVWRDDNWEIYLAHGDGSVPLRLTNNASDEEAPSMALGCGQIALSADRDDNQDIYLMHSDGSGLRRLTSQPARDVLPALAPDGAAVAFQTYRHGDEPEIYLVELASGAEVRITNNQIYDGQPDWSPDGQHIAFISDRSGIKNVWIMNRDGSNPRQVTDMPHAAAPKWSPDGQRIAFASDDVGTGFTSLWVVNQDGSETNLVWRAYGSQTDAWPDDWSFDGRYILYEEANWDYADGWYILSATLDLIDPEQTSDRQHLVEGGVNMAATWALCDLTPPVTTLTPVNSVSSSPVALSWSGQDDRSSYIEFEVQYRPGGLFAWSTWQLTPGNNWTPLTSASFGWDTLGRTLSFRVRARDLLGRIGDWSPSPEGTTTTLPAQVSGYVYDVRGVPLANVSLSALASPLPSAHSAANGYYALAAVSDWSTHLSAQATGYATQSLDRPALADMAAINFRLTTGEETLVNGGFEAGLAGWFAAGAIAHISPGYAFDQRCVLLGASTSQRLSSTEPSALGASSVYQQIVVPSDVPYPTLSFAYVLGDGSTGPQGVLQMLVQEGGSSQVMASMTSPTLWQTTPGGARYPIWQYSHLDLGPWRGKAITLTVQHQQHLGSGTALLDRMSVSPWRTPYITSMVPSVVAVGQATQIRMRGNNFSSATEVSLGARPLGTSWLGDTLLAQVPSDMAPGRYDVWVSNPGGYASARLLAFSVGGYLSLPLIIRP